MFSSIHQAFCYFNNNNSNNTYETEQKTFMTVYNIINSKIQKNPPPTYNKTVIFVKCMIEYVK